MARHATVSVTGVGTSAPITLDWTTNPPNIGVQVVSTGTATYQVQGTMDDVGSGTWNAATGDWFPLALGITGLGGIGTVQMPLTAIRLSVTLSIGQTVSMSVWESGGTPN